MWLYLTEGVSSSLWTKDSQPETSALSSSPTCPESKLSSSLLNQPLLQTPHFYQQSHHLPVIRVWDLQKSHLSSRTFSFCRRKLWPGSEMLPCRDPSYYKEAGIRPTGMPCSHSFCFCGQVLLCLSVPGDRTSPPAAKHCTEGGGCCPCAERQLHLQAAKWHLIKPRKLNWEAMEECPKWGGRAKSHRHLGIFTGLLPTVPSVSAQCLGHSKSSKHVC